MGKCKYPNEVCASMTVLNGKTYCDSAPCVLRDKIPPQTNADKIRSMSDEELAKIIAAEPMAERIPFCKNLPQCEIDLEQPDGIPQERCVQCALDWLRQPAKEETE